MLDFIDRKILEILQADATRPIVEIADAVHLSHTPCWRRIQKLEEGGYITRRVALLDREKLNCNTTVFVAVRTSQHSIEWLELFHKTVAGMPEVVDFHRLSGDIDYLIRVVLPDIKHYDAWYKRLIAKIPLSDVSSMFSMEEIKSSTQLPLAYVEMKQT